MTALSIIINIILILISIVLIIAVLMQEGQRQGLGAIGGGAETFLGKNKASTLEGKLKLLTKIAAVVFIVLAIVATMVSGHISAQKTAAQQAEIEREGAVEIASRSRGTPRIANRMLRRVRDFAQVRGKGVITKPIADEALSRLEVDKAGLDSVDRRMLRSIIELYNGGPVGLEALAATINEEAVTLEDVYEPFLLQNGFLTRTMRGRCVTQKAYEHLGIEYLGQQRFDL